MNEIVTKHTPDVIKYVSDYLKKEPQSVNIIVYSSFIFAVASIIVVNNIMDKGYNLDITPNHIELKKNV